MRYGFLLAFLIICQLLSGQAYGEITLDGTLGPGSQLTGPHYQITDSMGTQMGGNLFHSFGNFNLYNGESATFTGPNNIANIISRVTGGNSSFIDGLLSSEIVGANLFFLNPVGVMFGPNAALNVTGSFYVSTADYIRLGADGLFDVSSPENSILSVAPPSEFGFLDSSVGQIGFDGAFLNVLEGKAFSIIGGDITLNNSYLYAPGGQINIVSTASAGTLQLESGLMEGFDEGGLGNIEMKNNSVEYLVNDDFEVANLDVNGDAGGTIYIRGGAFTLNKGIIESGTSGNTDGQYIDISVTKQMQITGGSEINAYTWQGQGAGADIHLKASKLMIDSDSKIFSASYGKGNSGNIDVKVGEYESDSALLQNLALDSGNAGNINIEADSISLKDGSQIDVSARRGSTGKGGNLTINAKKSITISGRNIDNYPSGLFSNTEGSGDAGTISINADTLDLEEGGIIFAASADEGNAGSIYIKVGQYAASGGDIQNVALSQGDAGNVEMQAKNIHLQDGAQIDVSTREGSTGMGGNITLKADEKISIDGQDSQEFPSGLFANTEGTGAGGKITINSHKFSITNGGFVNAGAEYTGNAGSIFIDVQDFEARSSLIQNLALHEGNAGDITLNANNISMLDGAQISVSARADSTGKGGSITVNAKGSMLIAGGDSAGYPSGLFASTAGAGAGGSISINAGSLSLSGETYISASSQGKGNAGDIYIKTDKYSANKSFLQNLSLDKGNAGNIKMDVGSISLENGAQISVSSRSGSTGKGGNLTINATGTVLISGKSQEGYTSGLLAYTSGAGRGGQIMLTANRLQIDNLGYINVNSAGTGDAGNISINVEDCDINDGYIQNLALAEGNAGDINIDAKNVILNNGAQISVSARDDTTGHGGNLTINASDDVLISGENKDGFPSGLFASTEGIGNGGKITLTANRLRIDSDGYITASSKGQGNAGDIYLKVNYGEIDDGLIQNLSQAEGDAGDIDIDTIDFMLTNGAQISVSARSGSTGKGGNLTINANGDVLLSGKEAAGFPSGLFASTEGTGAGGTITLMANNFTLNDGAIVSASSHDKGKAGNIDVIVNSYNSSGGYMQNLALSEGDAGNIKIDSNSVNLTNGAQIDVSARIDSTGQGGNITVNSTGTVTISGNDASGDYQSGIYASTRGAGDGGKITINAKDVLIENEGRVSAFSFGTGRAGDININASGTIKLENGYVKTLSDQSEGGNITIKGKDIHLFKNSGINAHVKTGTGDGGNVTINSGTFIAMEGVSVTAFVDEGFGGDIKVDSDLVFLDDGVVFDASSKIEGQHGIVEVDSPIVDISGMMTILTNEFGIKKELQPASCEKRNLEELSTFSIKGTKAPGLLPAGIMQNTNSGCLSETCSPN